MNSVNSLISYIMKSGCKASVSDEEGLIQDVSFVRESILNAIESVDGCFVDVYLSDKYLGRAYISQDCDPEEKVYDFTDNDFFNSWYESEK